MGRKRQRLEIQRERRSSVRRIKRECTPAPVPAIAEKDIDINVVYSTMLCTVKCCVQYNIVYSTMLCTVQRCVQCNVVYSTTLCTVQCCVQYNGVIGCKVMHCDVIDSDLYKYKLL